jgi:hypothetical protein
MHVRQMESEIMKERSYSTVLLPYLPQRSLEVGVVAVEDAAQRVVGLQLGADAQRSLEHACMCVPALAIEAPLLAHRVQLQKDSSAAIYYR